MYTNSLVTIPINIQRLIALIAHAHKNAHTSFMMWIHTCHMLIWVAYSLPCIAHVAITQP